MSEQQVEHRQGRMEGILEQVVTRLDSLEAAQRQEIAALRQEIASTNRRLDSQFRWLVGILFGMVGLLVTILLKVL